MRRPILALALAVLTAAAVVGVAAGDGPQGPSPGVAGGWEGDLAPNGKVRYVTIAAGRQTIVEVVQVRGGRILRWGLVDGEFGSPLVAFDGTTAALSADGKTLVLASYPLARRATVSRFAIVSTKTLARRAVVSLRGTWSFDAVSPDASTLFLIQYLSSAQSSAYRVRAFDLVAKRLFSGAIVDRREEEAEMRGSPATRKTSADGRWAYTLYARQGKAPFVHALDTVERQAYCLDLPLRLGQPKQMGLRLRLVRNGQLEVRNGRTTLAVVDTEKLTVQAR
jgi:hypothetical protein